MSTKYDVVKIRVAELNTVQVKIPKWETAILVAIYGNSAQVVGEQVVARALPSPDQEFRRLANKYGPRGDDETKYVAAVYGNFGIGIAALGNAIRAAATSESDNRVPQFVSDEAKQRYLDQEASAQLDAEINRKAREAMIAKYDAEKAEALATLDAVVADSAADGGAVDDLLSEVA